LSTKILAIVAAIHKTQECKMKLFTRISALFFMAMVLISAPLHAQPFQAGLNFIVGSPQGEFADNVTNNGYGLAGHFGVRPGKSPFLVGINFDYLIYGSETRKESFNSNIPDVNVDVTRTNNILQSHLFLRIQPADAFISPYIDGLVGFSYLFTETSVKSEHNYDDDDEIASSTNFDDWTSSYGAGAGFLIRVYNGQYDDNSGNKKDISVHIDLGVHYLRGGNAEYLKEGAVEISDGRVVFHPSKSNTDLLNFRIGAAVAF
jgi:hypothetical protein